LKARLIGFNGNTDWFNIDRGAEGVFSVGHILVARDLGVSGHGAGCGFASAISSSVWVSSFSAKSVGFNVFEGRVHQATIASSITIRASAINELLFREGGQVAMFKEDSAFNTAGGAECPAGTALSLIFNSSDGALLRPVKRARRIGTNLEIAKGDGFTIISSEFGFVTKVDVLEFTAAKISEFVEFDSPGVVASVVCLNEVVVGLESVIAVEEFFGRITLGICVHPGYKRILVNRFWDGRGGDDKEGC